jgi:putative polyketide hydroxylase
MPESTKTSVVVVGAGPAGLATAITLARLGVRCLVVDRLSARSDAPRATGISAGAMERLRRWDLQERAEAAAVDLETTGLRTPSLVRAAEGVAFPVGMLTRDQARIVSPARSLCVGQDVVEPLLEAHLRTLPSAQLSLGTSFAGLEQDAAGVTVRLRDDEDLGERTVRADFVVGADGLRSAVRAVVGIATDATEGLSDSVGVRVRAPLWDLVPEAQRHVIYAVTDPVAGGALIPAGEDRWVYATERRPGVDASEAALLPLLRAAAGVADLPVSVEHLIELQYGTALARTFRRGRVLLAGDAAHRVTPRGATGMGMAIVGGEALGWRLGWGCAAGRRWRCWTTTRPNGARSRRTTSRAPRGRTARSGRPRRSGGSTSAPGSPTCGSTRRPRRSTCSAPPGPCSPARPRAPGPRRPRRCPERWWTFAGCRRTPPARWASRAGAPC